MSQICINTYIYNVSVAIGIALVICLLSLPVALTDIL